MIAGACHTALRHYPRNGTGSRTPGNRIERDHPLQVAHLGRTLLFSTIASNFALAFDVLAKGRRSEAITQGREPQLEVTALLRHRRGRGGPAARAQATRH